MSKYSREHAALLTCAEVRKLIEGILENMHLGILTKANLRQRAEDLLLSNSDYWLSYAGAAFIGWLLDDRNLAAQGLKKALNIDDLRTSLFFLFISLREKRQQAAEKWLERYLEELDPFNLSSDFVCFMNLYVAGLLNTAGERQAGAVLSAWQAQQEADPEITNAILEQWHRWFREQRSAVSLSKEEHFEILSKTQNMDAEGLLRGAHLPQAALTKLQKLLQVTYKQQEEAAEINTYLTEFIENDRAASEKETDSPDLTYAEIFLKEEEGQRCFAYAELLSLWVLEARRYGASAAASQYALAALKDWIRSAADDVQAETIQKFPDNVTFHMDLESFNGHTAPFDYASRDGKNERENVQALQKIIEPWKQEELAKNRPGWKVFVLLASILGGGALLIFGGGWVITNHPVLLVLVVALALVGLLGWAAGIVCTIILALITALIMQLVIAIYTAHTTLCIAAAVLVLVALAARLYHKTIGMRRAIEKSFRDYALHQQWAVCSCMAEVADFYDFYMKNIKKQQELREFLNGLRPEDFIRQRHTSGRRIRV